MNDIHALSGAYAVDALEDDERVAFEQHMSDCAACRTEVVSLREAAAMLGGTTVSGPPSELRSRLLADAAARRPSSSAVATVIPLRGRNRRGRIVALLAAAAAAVALAAGGVASQMDHHDGPQDRFSAIREAADARTYTVPVGDGGTLTVVVSKERNEAYIETAGMPAAPAGHQYNLWLRHGSTTTPAGVMPADPATKVLFGGDAATADGAAVTVEAEGTEPNQQSDDVVATVYFDG